MDMETAVLNVKITKELKEQLRSYAELHGETLGAVTEVFLQEALAKRENGTHVLENEVDSQHTEEDVAEPLNQKEIKALRKLLKKRK